MDLGSPVQAAPEAPRMDLGLGGEPPWYGGGESLGEAPTLQATEPQQLLMVLLFISCRHHFAQSNLLQRVFNISETDEPSIAQAIRSLSHTEHFLRKDAARCL